MSTPLTPERLALSAQVRDLRNWQECLKRCRPAFAKDFIHRIRMNGAIEPRGAEALLAALGLGAL